MTLPDGYSDLPNGKLAAVVTCLEMFERPPLRKEPEQPDLTLALITRPDPQWYRDLYRRIGENWIWASHLEMPVEQLAGIIQHPEMEVWAVQKDGRAEGIMQLDFREKGICELLFFGLTDRIVGKGAGRWLMNRALDRAWSKPISRLWVHTCTLDHPAALPFYVRSGFTPFKRRVEVFDDPRLTGVLSADAAPHLPVIRP